MRGNPTLFLPGLDHASIAAQFVLDGIIAKEGESRQSLGRDRYLERMRAFSDSTRPVMLGQQRRVGASADWGRLRYTMDEGSAKAVRAAFERLYRDGLAYPDRGPHQLVPGLSHERERPRGGPDAGDRDAMVGPLPPHR
jgi:valyl-tRNA synthetase